MMSSVVEYCVRLFDCFVFWFVYIIFVSRVY